MNYDESYQPNRQQTKERQATVEEDGPHQSIFLHDLTSFNLDTLDRIKVSLGSWSAAHYKNGRVDVWIQVNCLILGVSTYLVLIRVYSFFEGLVWFHSYCAVKCYLGDQLSHT